MGSCRRRAPSSRSTTRCRRSSEKRHAGGWGLLMSTYVARRLIFSVFVLWGALTVVFLAVRAVPGDPAQMMLGTNATAADVDALRERLGLNRPLIVQYGAYMLQTLRLDLGESIRMPQPVVGLVAERLPTTGKLALTAIVIAG